MKTQVTRLVLAAGLVLGALGQAQAASYCSDYVLPLTHPDGLSKSDMTFNTAPSADCYGVVDGNDDLADINAIVKWKDEDYPWSFAVKDDIEKVTQVAGVGTYNNVKFTLLAADATSGNWTLTGEALTSGALPQTIDFVATLKAGTQWAAYLFDNVVVDGSDTGTFKISFTFENPAGKDITQNLSHLSLFMRSGEGGGSDDDTDVPEPATLALMGLALGGLGLSRRRRKAS